MARALRFALGLLVVAVIVGLPAGYAAYRNTHFRNFRVVQPGVLYRSGQMTLTGLKMAEHDYGIKTVITLRDASYADGAPPDWAEEEYCDAQGINYYRISPRTWWAPDGSVPAEEGVRQFRAIMDNPANYPVLIHCFGGIHRTGAFCAIYRMEYDHWTRDEAMGELKAHGFGLYAATAANDYITQYLLHYQPRPRLIPDIPVMVNKRAF